MKKLSLNKKIIAQLNNPDNIYGGVPVTYNNCAVALSRDFAHKNGDCKSWDYQACILTQYWHCPSNAVSYCYNQSCPHPQIGGACASADTKC